MQALAAERSRVAEERKMTERLKRQQDEKQKKAASEAMERERAKRQREALIDQERKKKEQIETKRREAELKEERMKRLEQERKEALLKKNQTGTDMRKFARASDKAIRRASGGRSRLNDPNRKRDTDQEDEDGFLNGSSGSILTREEKRQKRQMALLGLGSSTVKKKVSRMQNKAAQNFSGGEFIALGTVKRDRRTIDEIERDLEARKGKITSTSQQVTQTLPASSNLREKQKMKVLEQERKNAIGLSPADYLPGAPVRADLLAKAKAKETKIQAKKQESSTKKKEKIPEEILATKRKETARDRFLREEEERRRERQKHSSQNYEEDDDDSEDDDDDDEYESEGIDDEPDPSNIRDQIWQIFGRKRSAYINKGLEDSDDDDMEADMQSVAREEARSARLARLEDEREEKELRKREQEKAARKAARSRRIE